jgi:Uri superfamily endonuclease
MAKAARSFTDALRHPGCYSLIIELQRKKTIRVGKLGEAVFPAGTYVYTGSAMKGLGTRLRRHCSRKKKIHWHIDYLLTLPEARVRQIIYIPRCRVRNAAKTNGSLHDSAQRLSLKTSARPIAGRAAEAICYFSLRITCLNSQQSDLSLGLQFQRDTLRQILL